MKKSTAIRIFENPRKLADALGITRQAIYQWPDDLPLHLEDRIVGAAIRCKREDYMRVVLNELP